MQRTIHLRDHHEQIAADPVHLRLNDAHDCVGGNGGIDRVTAAGQNLGARLRGEWLTGGDNPESGRDSRDRPVRIFMPARNITL